MTALFLIVRGIVALVGGFVGWIAGGLVVRLLYRVLARRPAPGWLVPLGKAGCGTLLAVLIFLFLPLGGGDGWGWGPGFGIGPGTGPGQNGETGEDDGKKKGNAEGKGGPSQLETATRTQLDIELVGGADVMNGRYYLINREPPPQSLAAVEETIKERSDKLEVHLIFTDASVATSHPAAWRLRELLRQYKIPMVEVTQ